MSQAGFQLRARVHARALFWSLAVFFSTIQLPTSASAQDAYDTLISAANQLLKEGKLGEARQTATMATTLAPNRFEGWFIAGVIANEQGFATEARPLLEKALELAPEHRKLRIRTVLETLPGGSGTSASLASEGGAPATPIDAATKRELTALMLIPEEADRAPTPARRRELLEEFLKRSRDFLGRHPDYTQLWVLHAAAALETNSRQDARVAAERLSKGKTTNDKVEKISAMLDRRGLTAPLVIPASFEIPDLNIRMIGVPAGAFLMGSPATENGRDDFEGPQVHVTITHSFWLGETETTQSQWKAVMGLSARQQAEKQLNRMRELGLLDRSDVRRLLSNVKDDARLPINYITFDEAAEYCRRLTDRETRAGRLPTGYTYYLPTEAEWEWACRADTDTPYSIDAPVDDLGWHKYNSGGRPQNVKTKRPNAWGLCDMHGNVFEWCSDISIEYSKHNGRVVDPTGYSSGKFISVRGGSFNNEPRHLRSAARGEHGYGRTDDIIGFRPALLKAPKIHNGHAPKP